MYSSLDTVTSGSQWNNRVEGMLKDLQYKKQQVRAREVVMLEHESCKSLRPMLFTILDNNFPCKACISWVCRSCLFLRPTMVDHLTLEDSDIDIQYLAV